MSTLPPSQGRIHCVLDDMLSHLKDDHKTLLSCRLVSRSFYESSTRAMFRSTDILSTAQAHGFVEAIQGGHLPTYIHQLCIGHQRTRSHDRQTQPLEVDTRQLAEICDVLHSLKRIEFGKIVLRSPYNICSRAPIPGGIAPSHLILLRNIPDPAEDPPLEPSNRFRDLGIEVEEVKIFVPSRSTLVVDVDHESDHARPEGGQALFSQRLSITEGCDTALLHYYLGDAVLAGDHWHSMAFYGSSIGTWKAFSHLLALCGGSIRSLALSWTCLRMLHSCEEVSRVLAPAIAQCTSLESLTLSLLLGPRSASTIDHQWRANLALLANASRDTLCSVNLVIDMNAADESRTYMMQLKHLDWTKITDLLRVERYSVLRTVQYHVNFGKGLRIRDDVEEIVHAGLYPLLRDKIVVSSPPYVPHAAFYD